MPSKSSKTKSQLPTRARYSIHVTTVVDILRAAERVRRKTMGVVGQHGLTLPQFNALRILWQEPEGLSTMQVSERLLERSPGITRLIDGLENQGLVERIPHPSDRRATVCRLTDRGRELADLLAEEIEVSDRELTHDLSTPELKQLKDLVCRIGDDEG